MNRKYESFENEIENGKSLYPKWHHMVFDNPTFYELDQQYIFPYLKKYGKTMFDMALELGSGSGLWLQKVWKQFPSLAMVGIEKDGDFYEHTKKLLPELEFVHGNALQRSHFGRETFRFIFCLRDSMYHQNRKERQRMWENMYYWLQPNGYVFLHVFNPQKLNPGPQNFSQCYSNDKKELVCHTYYDSFIHLSSFIQDKSEEEKYIYRERIQVLEKPETISLEVDMEHPLWIPSRDDIQKEWEYNGYRLVEEISYEKDWIPDISLVILQKPQTTVSFKK